MLPSIDNNLLMKLERQLKDIFSRSGFTDGYKNQLGRDMFGIRTKEDVLA